MIEYNCAKCTICYNKALIEIILKSKLWKEKNTNNNQTNTVSHYYFILIDKNR